MLKINCIGLIIILYCIPLISRANDSQVQQVTIDNGMVKRSIAINNNSCNTTFLGFSGNSLNYMDEEEINREFAFLANGELISGNQQWEVIHSEKKKAPFKGTLTTLKLTGKEQVNQNLEVKLHFITYPDLPVIRKNMSIINKGQKEVKIEALNIEDFYIPWKQTETWTYTNYARQKKLGPYIGNWHDPAVVMYNFENKNGIVLGNESPGVLKRTGVFVDGDRTEIGLTHPAQEYTFAKYIGAGKSWDSPYTFLCLFQDANNPREALNGSLNLFLAKHLGQRLAGKKDKPVFVYNTWNPYRGDLSEEKMMKAIDAAADCGFQKFIIDAGWYTLDSENNDDLAWGDKCGDWLIDKDKFPNGLKPVFDYAKSKGMKPGFWISLTSAHPTSAVYREHPGWFVENKNGNPTNLHNPDQEINTACFGTDWYDYIKETILRYVNEYGLTYAKLDLSIVTSAYINDVENAGCYATDHPYHKNHQESFWVLYDRCFKLFDELHEEAPELFIDCTFETAGRLQLIDYAIVKHADGDWLSNIEDPNPVGSLRIRQMAWWRSPVIPASALVIGNLTLNDPMYELSIKSLAGSLPILLGDLTKVSKKDRAIVKTWSVWLDRMQEKYDYMLYRQDLPGYGEPMEGHWDGWARINLETKKGGIIGVFKQGAVETERRVTVHGLDEKTVYQVIPARSSKPLAEMTGKELKSKGFNVEITKEYDGKLFEIKLSVSEHLSIAD